MSQFRLLCGVYLKSLFGINRLRYSNDPKDKRKLRTYFILGPFIIVSLFIASGSYCLMMAQGLMVIGGLEAMPTAMFAAASLFTCIAAAYRSADVLLAFKDYDMVLSLPVSVRTVALSRLFINYITSLLLPIMLLLPAGAIYAYYARPAWTFYPMYIALVLATPVLPSIIGAFISVLIKNLVARIRGARFINMILLFALTIAYMYGVMSLNEGSTEAMGQLALDLSGSVSRIYPPAMLFNRAITLDAGAFALLLMLYALAFVAFAWVFSRVMRQMHAYITERRARRSFRMRTMRVSSAFSALFRRELGRYFASVIYVMNTAFGIVIIVLLSVVLAFSGESLIASLAGAEGLGADMSQIYSIIPYFFSFIAMTCCVTGSSVSLEGKQVWITQSIPVNAMDVWHAKLAVNALVLLPFCVISPIAFILALKPAGWICAAIILTPTVCGAFSALLGLTLNQKHHSFDWKNETVVVKQSMPVSVCIMGGVLMSLAGGAACFLLPAYSQLVTFGYLGALALADILLYASMRKHAEARLRAL